MMSQLRERFLALAVVPALALSLSACGSKPQETATTEAPPPPPPAAAEQAPATPAPPAGEVPPPTGMQELGPAAEEIIAFVEKLPATKGKDNKLSLKDGDQELMVEIVEVLRPSATRLAGGRSKVPVKAKVGEEEVEVHFIVVGETPEAAMVDEIVVAKDGGRHFIWSADMSTWVFNPGPGAPPAEGGMPGAPPAEGGAAGAPPAEGGMPGAPPAEGGAAGAPPAGEAAPPAGGSGQ